VGISILWVPLAFLFDGVTVILLPLRLGGDATTLGLVSLIGIATAASLQPVLGWFSDRVRHRVDRRVFSAVAAIPTIIGLWVLVGTTGVVAGIAGYVLLQASATAIQAGQQALIPEHVGTPNRGRAAGLKAAFDVGGSFVAFLALGVLLASGELAPAAAAITLLLVASILALLVLVPPRGMDQAPRPRASRLPQGLGRLILARFFFLFATYAVGRFLLLLLAERLGIATGQAADEAAGLLAMFTLVTAAAAIPFGWLADRRSRRGLMAAGAVVASAGIVILIPGAGLLGVAAGGLLMSVGTAAFVTSNWAATTALVPPTDAGRLMAVANLGTGLAAAAAGALGPLIDVAGFEPALLVAAVAAAFALVPLATPSYPVVRGTENPT
jgi:MFS family permease